MGHQLNIHRQFYQVMSSTIERVKIAKLLVMADSGVVPHGKHLNDLEIMDIPLVPDTYEGQFTIEVFTTLY